VITVSGSIVVAGDGSPRSANGEFRPSGETTTMSNRGGALSVAIPAGLRGGVSISIEIKGLVVLFMTGPHGCRVQTESSDEVARRRQSRPPAELRP
jgi:hypothetical protein